jgi:hypothetical protein
VGEAIEFDILLADAGSLKEAWPGKEKMKTSLLGTYARSNGGSVWIGYQTISMPRLPPLTGSPTFFPGASVADLKKGSVKALLFGDEANGLKVIYDVPVEWTRR